MRNLLLGILSLAAIAACSASVGTPDDVAVTSTIDSKACVLKTDVVNCNGSSGSTGTKIGSSSSSGGSHASSSGSSGDAPLPEPNGAGDNSTAYEDCLNGCLQDIVPKNADLNTDWEDDFKVVTGTGGDVEACRQRCAGLRAKVEGVFYWSFK